MSDTSRARGEAERVVAAGLAAKVTGLVAALAARATGLAAGDLRLGAKVTGLAAEDLRLVARAIGLAASCTGRVSPGLSPVGTRVLGSRPGRPSVASAR